MQTWFTTPINTESTALTLETLRKAFKMEPVEIQIPAALTESAYNEAQETFSSVPIPVDKEHLLAEIRSAYAQAYVVVSEILPDGRLKSLARTSLEESSMWAVKALSRS